MYFTAELAVMMFFLYTGGCLIYIFAFHSWPMEAADKVMLYITLESNVDEY